MEFNLGIANFILSLVSFIVLVIYAYFTYLLAKDTTEPNVSFVFSQSIPFSSHLNFDIVNKSKVEVESWGKLWAKNKNNLFQFKDGFYGNKHSWILQPFTQGFGHFELKDLKNKENISLDNFVQSKKISSMSFFFQIKYRKIGSLFWKKSTPQKFAYDFDKNLFWLNV